MTEWFAHHVEETSTYELIGHGHHAFDWGTAIVGTIASLVGIGLSALFYLKPSDLPAKISNAVRPFAKASEDKFYVDEGYATLFVMPVRLLATASRFLDVQLVDRLVHLVAYVPRLIGRDALRPIQNGLIQSYAVVTAMGVALLLAILLLI